MGCISQRVTDEVTTCQQASHMSSTVSAVTMMISSEYQYFAYFSSMLNHVPHQCLDIHTVTQSVMRYVRLHTIY